MSFRSPNNQITLFLDPNSYCGKQILAYAQTYNVPIASNDIRKTKLTGTQLFDLAKLLGVDITDMVDARSETYQSLIGDDHNFNKEEWATILKKNPECMRSIALKGKKGIFISTPTDMLKL